MATTIKIRYGSDELRRRLSLLMAALAGRERNDLIEGAKLRVAVAFFSKVKEAYIIKARGGIDETGMSWPPLSPKTLAYGRHTQSGKSRVLKTTAKKQQKAGANKYQSLRAYNVAYREALARFSLSLPKAEAKRRAQNVAFYVANKKSGPTKIAAAETLRPGADYDILRDTGILLNSLQPGIVTGGTYSPKEGQVVESEGSILAVGTNVEYAATHHYGRKHIPARPLWPKPSNVPQSWKTAFADAMQRGIERAVEIATRAA